MPEKSDTTLPETALGELSLAAQLKSDQVERENRGLQQKAFTDGLTGIANRAAFDNKLEVAWVEARRKGRPIGLALVDIDHFKHFNDSFGHQTGDAVLRAVANCLQKQARDVDFVARYGGEEFVVVMPNVERITAAITCVKMRKGIENEVVRFDGRDHQVTVSVGAVIVPKPGPPYTMKTLVEAADKLLYCSKNKGRNCCSMKELRPKAPSQAVASA